MRETGHRRQKPSPRRDTQHQLVQTQLTCKRPRPRQPPRQGVSYVSGSLPRPRKRSTWAEVTFYGLQKRMCRKKEETEEKVQMRGRRWDRQTRNGGREGGQAGICAGEQTGWKKDGKEDMNPIRSSEEREGVFSGWGSEPTAVFRMRKKRMSGIGFFPVNGRALNGPRQEKVTVTHGGPCRVMPPRRPREHDCGPALPWAGH